MTPTTFLYNAHACALGGFFTRPFAEAIDSVASASLPVTGGSGKESVTGYTYKDLITIGKAHTELTASQSSGDGSYNTTITTTVEGFTFTDVIKAKRIVANITSHHPGNDDETNVSTDGSLIEDLTIAGEPVILSVDPDIVKCPSFASFKAKKGNGLAIGKSGIARCSIYANIKHSLVQQIEGQQVIVVPNFGKVYLGEVYMKHSQRRLTMMRLQLGSPQAGSVSICGGDGNGTTFP